MHWYRNIYFLKLPWVYSVDQPPPPAGSYFIGPKASLAITWGGLKSAARGLYFFFFTSNKGKSAHFTHSVMRVRSNTFDDPLVQKISQNEPSSPIISVLESFA